MLRPKRNPQSESFDPRPDLDGLFRTHGGWLRRFLARRFGRDRADDLSQETFVRLAQSTIEMRSPKSVLARMALNVAYDAERQASAYRRPRLVSNEGLSEAATPASQLEALVLKQVVLGLPDNLKDVFLLSRFGGMTYEEIAVHRGISVKAVEKRMTKALKICVARLRA